MEEYIMAAAKPAAPVFDLTDEAIQSARENTREPTPSYGQLSLLNQLMAEKLGLTEEKRQHLRTKVGASAFIEILKPGSFLETQERNNS